MMLLVDQGNTRLKWQVLDAAGRVLQAGAVDEPAALFRGLPSGLSPSTILVASVAGAEGRALLDVELRARFVVLPVFMESPAACAGLSNGYLDAARLGVDRWLAMLAAWDEVRGTCLVVDAGTALTIDAVAGGRHLGGYILPGLAMQRRALGVHTARVGEHSGGGVGWGVTTSQAVGNGILLAAVSAVERSFVELQGSVEDTCTLFVTGGDAQDLAEHLSVPCVLRPDLVFRGMLCQWKAAVQ